MTRTILILGLCYCMASVARAQQTREEKVRADKAKVETEGFWIYNDLEHAYETARTTGKPILVSLRCIPCEECVKLDDDLIDNDPVLRPLLEKFVCVRVVGTNGLDLDIYQYDTDQSFAIFMLNADKTIYGRFGTRSHRTDWAGDVSLTGMARALEGALELHNQYPTNREQLAGKRGRPLEFSSPEKFPSLSEKYTDQLNYEGNVVQSCIHCHQIGDARRDYYWDLGKSIPEDLVFPYPHPKAVGLILDPEQRATIKRVSAETPASEAGLQTGDEILAMNGQPLLSMADVQWVLQHVPVEGGQVSLTIRRGSEELRVPLVLKPGWRRKDDPSWRVSAWGLSRIALGGMRLEALTEEERREASLDQGMALRVRSAGKYGAHATARKTGFRPDDILVEYDGQTDFKTEADLFAHVSQNRSAGERVPIRFLRDGREMSLSLPIQK